MSAPVPPGKIVKAPWHPARLPYLAGWLDQMVRFLEAGITYQLTPDDLYEMRGIRDHLRFTYPAQPDD